MGGKSLHPHPAGRVGGISGQILPELGDREEKHQDVRRQKQGSFLSLPPTLSLAVWLLAVSWGLYIDPKPPQKSVHVCGGTLGLWQRTPRLRMTLQSAASFLNPRPGSKWVLGPCGMEHHIVGGRLYPSFENTFCLTKLSL